jgi:hypothetical protein
MAQILDQFGKPAVYHGSTGASLIETTDDSLYRATRPRLDNDIALLLPKVKHRALLSDSRWIRTAFPIVGGAVEQKANYVSGSGWKAKFSGTDTDYGNRLEAILSAADSLSDLRGFPFDFDKDMTIACMSYDVDGDFFIHKTRRRDLPGYPAFQFLEAHRFGSPYTWGGKVQNGKYDGARIINGIIYDDAGAEIAYNLLGRCGEPDQQIPARDMIHAFDPRWFSEGRALPNICYAILDWYDVKETRDNEKIGQKANAALVMVEENATGSRPVPNNVTGATPPTSPAGLQTEIMEKGLIRYIRSGSGKITAHTSNRPSDGAAKFEASILAGAFYGMGWRIEMMDLSKLGGAGVRGFQDNINTVIAERWKVINKIAVLCRQYQTACFIDRGDIEDHPEWDKVTHAEPADFTVDAQRTSQTERDNVRAGVTSMPAVIRRNGGGDAEDVLREQAKYLKLKKKIANEEGVSEAELGTLMLPGDESTSVLKAEDEAEAQAQAKADEDARTARQ